MDGEVEIGNEKFSSLNLSENFQKFQQAKEKFATIEILIIFFLLVADWFHFGLLVVQERKIYKKKYKKERKIFTFSQSRKLSS